MTTSEFLQAFGGEVGAGAPTSPPNACRNSLVVIAGRYQRSTMPSLSAARIELQGVEPADMSVNHTAITPSHLRSAPEITLAGEALRITIRLHREDSDAVLDLDGLREPRTKRKLERSGARAVHKAMNGSYDVTLEHRTDALLYHVTGYGRLGNRRLSIPTQPGLQFENQTLQAMSSLAPKIAKIASKRLDRPVLASASSELGAGLLISGGLFAQRADEDQEARIHQLQTECQDFRSRLWLSAVFGFILLAACAIGGALVGFTLLGLTGGLMLGVGFAVIAVLNYSRLSDRQQETRELRDQHDLHDLLDEERERRAQKQFQVHSHQLRRYYEQALRQRGVIFSIGVLCIGAGFGIIISAGLLIWLSDAELSEQIVVASLGAVGGILGNFVAVMYLNMFKETIKSIGAFHDRLVFTNHLHFANVLAAKVTDDTMRDGVLAEMAQAMAASDAGAHAAPTAT